MNFVFTEDQLAITATARAMFVETCTGPSLRRMLETKAARNDQRWAAIVEMGLPGMLAPEAAGGLALSLVDLVGIAEAAGYVALPEPLIEQAGVAIPLLAQLADDRGWLKRAAAGAIVAIGHPINPFVTDADSADAFMLADGNTIHLVQREAVTLTREESFDPFRRLFRIGWAPSPDTRVAEGWGLAAERGALMAASQLIGLAQRAIDLAVDYAKQRTQFGKPIGGYQAVKHLLASAQVRVEFARPVVHAAAVELPLNTLASRARVAHAKIAAGEAADLAMRSAVQVHGAMGITWEIDLHFFLRRTLALRSAWGTAAWHNEIVMQRMLSLPTGPDALFASELLGQEQNAAA